MKAFVTGSLGFLGMALVERLTADDHEVTGFDSEDGATVMGDLRDLGAVTAAMKGCDTVFHLAAVADISKNWEDPDRLFRINTLGTFNVLEACRANRIKTLAFASSSAVYGDRSPVPTPEDCPWPSATSPYAASKMAGEAMVSAYCAGAGIEGYIFRFSPVVGERYTHGHIFDFVKRLLQNPARLEVRGNARQRKPYIYVGDVVQALIHTMGLATGPGLYPRIFNVTVDEPTELMQSILWICSEMELTPVVGFGDEDRGWVGDMPELWPSNAKLRSTGWSPAVTSEEGVRRTVRWLLANRWVMDGKYEQWASMLAGKAVTASYATLFRTP